MLGYAGDVFGDILWKFWSWILSIHVIPTKENYLKTALQIYISDLNTVYRSSLVRKEHENVTTMTQMKTGKPTSPQCFAWTAPPLLGHQAPQPAASAAVLRHSQATALVGTCRCPGASNGGGFPGPCRHPAIGSALIRFGDTFSVILFYILAGHQRV